MTAAPAGERRASRGCRLGSHRVLEPADALPQAAHRLDATPIPYANEILVDVDALNLDAASFRQIAEVCGGDPGAIAAHVRATVAERGKQHNAVTGSGGMFVGRVAEIGAALRERPLAPGDRIASLVSLTLTPLTLDEVHHVDVATGQLQVRGRAILFESGLYARLPHDLPDAVALAVLDVAGAPAQVARLTASGANIVVIGADGKSGLLACAAARTAAGPQGRVVGVVPDRTTASAGLLVRHRIVDALVEADARDALATRDAVAAVLPSGADLTVNCVNVGGTEMASILVTKERGTVYFFSMATSFTAAALGAEGAGADVTMIVGNGYAAGHAEFALATLRAHEPILAHFLARYGSRP